MRYQFALTDVVLEKVHTIVGGLYNLQCGGTFAGGTCRYQLSVDEGVSYNDVGSAAVWTAKGTINANIPTCRLKFLQAGGGGSSVITGVAALIEQKA